VSDAPDRSRDRTRGAPRALALCLAAALTLAAAAAGYEQVFSTNAAYDDEGYVMLSLVSHMRGRPLYDETYTQYGPAYFVLERAFFAASDLPVSHDVTRLKTLALWLVAAWLAGAVVRRLGGSRGAALAAFVVAFLHLERLCLEPGHPQELCVVGLLLVPLLVGRDARTRRLAWRPVALGLVVGAVVMTKPNVGVLLLVAGTLSLLLATTPSRWTTLLGAVAVPSTLLLPFVVAHRHLLAPKGIVLPALVASATLGVVVTARRHLRRSRSMPFTMRDLVGFVAGVAAVVGASAAAALAGGTTLRGLAYGLVGQHLAFVAAFASPAPIPTVLVLWAVLAVALAVRSSDDPRAIAIGRTVAALALGWTCLRHLAETSVPLTHGLVDRGGSGILVGLAAPALWVLVADDERAADRLVPRLALCLVAALQPLGAYPSPGTQMAIGSVAVAICVILALDDGLAAAARRLPRARVAMAALVVLLAATLLARDVSLYRRRAVLTPLDLPGAARVRMPAEDAARYRWLAATLRANADTFVFGEHARDSFYFWTGLEPPTGLNPTFWPHLLRHDEQQRIVDALEVAPRPAVVHEPYDGTLPADSPLLAYLGTRFRPALAEHDFEVWLPK
jgi:hypothetical protein